MDKFFETIKITIIAFFGAMTSWLGLLAIPFYVLVGANVIDYITGLIAAPYRGEERNSYKGIKGIAKKICMWLLVAVGVFLDIIINYLILNLGWQLPFKNIVASIVCVWLLCNELLSITENIADTGVAVPGFLQKIIKWVKTKSEESADIAEDKTKKE